MSTTKFIPLPGLAAKGIESLQKEKLSSQQQNAGCAPAGGRWPAASGGGAATCVQPGMEMAEPAAPAGWRQGLRFEVRGKPGEAACGLES